MVFVKFLEMQQSIIALNVSPLKARRLLKCLVFLTLYVFKILSLCDD
jgi:hypothetical protein